MKRFNWLLIGLVILCLGMIPLAGCVSKSEYEALQAENATLLQELAEIKEVYPLRNFSSVKELENWLNDNDVSERPPSGDYMIDYRRALQIQEDAMEEGYIIYPVLLLFKETLLVQCQTVINGDVYYFWPDEDVVHYMISFE